MPGFDANELNAIRLRTCLHLYNKSKSTFSLVEFKAAMKKAGYTVTRNHPENKYIKSGLLIKTPHDEYQLSDEIIEFIRDLDRLLRFPNYKSIYDPTNY